MIAAPFILRLLAAVFLLASCLSTMASMVQPASGTGYVEHVDYVSETHQLVVSGWAAPEQPNVFTTNLILHLGGQEIYRGRIERSERSDVVRSTSRPDWLWSGFSIRVALPANLPIKPQPLSARMRLGNGREFDLVVAPAAKALTLGRTASGPSLLSRLILLIAVGLPGLALWGPPRLLGVMPQGRGFSQAGLFGVSLILSFALLVAAGWTGSSLSLLLDHRGVIEHDEAHWAGRPQAVRSDEWQVITPLAISQTAHEPAFPVVNQNLGLDGQNMLIIGMTGVPVAHVSSLAKPATWGFFLFDLRRGLSWYWWFPFFACFGSVWQVLLRFFALDWRFAAGLAATVSASPYSVVFSGWPAYVVFFLACGLLAANAAFHIRTWKTACLVGGVLGLSVAGFALVLYPAWQISMAYLWLPFAIAWFVIRRAQLRFGFPQVTAAVVALGVSVLILVCWWLDAKEAIDSIRATVYPGQRSVEVGGDIDRWFLIKGFMSPLTMYRDSPLMVGASDAGSIVLFIVPLFAAIGLRLAAVRRIDAIAAALCGYLLIALWFMFHGFSDSVARISFWGMTTSYRLDLSLGVAQVLLVAWLATSNRRPTGSAFLAAAISAIAVIHAASLYRIVPPPILDNVPLSFIAMSLMALGGGGYLLLRGRYKAFAGVYGAWMLAAAVPFNPIGLAPLTVRPSAEFAGLVQAPEGAGHKRSGVAVLGERNWAMSLPAAGIPVVNSVFYYPQRTLWRRLDPSGELGVLYNRYQRVLFVLEAIDSMQGFRIDSPRLDEVRVTIDPDRFDFRLLGAARVLAAGRDGGRLGGNLSLRTARTTADWTLFEVVP